MKVLHENKNVRAVSDSKIKKDIPALFCEKKASSLVLEVCTGNFVLPLSKSFLLSEHKKKCIFPFLALYFNTIYCYSLGLCRLYSINPGDKKIVHDLKFYDGFSFTLV